MPPFYVRRACGMGPSPSDMSGDVTITFASAVVRLLGAEIRGVPRMHLRRGNAADQLPPLSTSKWSLHKSTGVLRLANLFCAINDMCT